MASDVLVVDSSGLLAALDAGEPDHRRVLRVLKSRRSLVVTDHVLAEVDHLVLHRLGHDAELAFLDQVIEGVYSREALTTDDLRRAREIAEKYADQSLGLTDTTLMALCERLNAREVVTLDQRHFSIFRDKKGRPLTLLP